MTRPVSSARPTLRFFDFANGSATAIAQIDTDRIGGFAVSPDRKTMILTQTETRGSDLMLVENVR